MVSSNSSSIGHQCLFVAGCNDYEEQNEVKGKLQRLHFIDTSQSFHNIISNLGGSKSLWSSWEDTLSRSKEVDMWLFYSVSPRYVRPRVDEQL